MKPTIATIVLDGEAETLRARIAAEAVLRGTAALVPGSIAAIAIAPAKVSVVSWLVGASIAGTLHVATGVSIASIEPTKDGRPRARVLTVEREVELTPPAPPAPLPEAEPELAPTPTPAVSTPSPSPASRRVASSRPATIARAAKVATATPANNAAAFDGFDMTVGDAPRFTGGVTAPSGTGTTPGSSAPTSGARPSDAATKVAPPRSLAKPVRLASRSWKCPWPIEARDLSRATQAVMLRVLVRADGSVATTEVLTDPGHGFGAAAQACARTTKFLPALDDDGTPFAASSPPVRVTFERVSPG